MPVLDLRLDLLVRSDASVTVPLDFHFTHEQAVGLQLARAFGGWVVRSEVGAFHATDSSVGDAVLWTIGGSHSVADTTFSATVAGNAVETPVNPLLLFDRALVPAVILATNQTTAWGNWRAAWVGTFETVGGLLTAEVTRDVSDVVKITAGTDLPHGAALSPTLAFSGGKRVRAGVRWSW